MYAIPTPQYCQLVIYIQLSTPFFHTSTEHRFYKNTPETDKITQMTPIDLMPLLPRRDIYLYQFFGKMIIHIFKKKQKNSCYDLLKSPESHRVSKYVTMYAIPTLH